MEDKGSFPNIPKLTGTNLTPTELDVHEPNEQDHKILDDGNEEGGDTLKCGYGRCTPSWLQRCNNPKMFLVFLSWFAIVQGRLCFPCYGLIGGAPRPRLSGKLF